MNLWIEIVKKNILLYRRIPYFKKINAKFLLVLIPFYSILFYKSFLLKNIFITLACCFFVVGIISFQSIKDGTFIRSSYLFPFLLRKKESFFYGISTDLFLKFIIILPFVLSFLFFELNSIIYFFIINILYITIIYLLSELSIISKTYLLIFNVFTLIPIFFVTLMIEPNFKGYQQETILNIYLNNNTFLILNTFLLIEISIILTCFFIYKKIYYKKIYN